MKSKEYLAAQRKISYTLFVVGFCIGQNVVALCGYPYLFKILLPIHFYACLLFMIRSYQFVQIKEKEYRQETARRWITNIGPVCTLCKR